MVERVRITARSGRVLVIGESRDGIVVEGAAVDTTDGETVVRGGSERVTVRVPTGTEVMAGTSSGNIELTGVLGAASVTTGSADIDVEDVASLDARTKSGKVTVTASRGPVRIRTKSSRARVERADGEVRITSTSGTIEIAAARGGVAAKTVSADIEITVSGTAPVTVETMSGDIEVRVADSGRPEVHLRTMSGDQRVECQTGQDFVLTGRAMSGNIRVTSA